MSDSLNPPWPAAPAPRPTPQLRLADDLRAVLDHDLASPEHVAALAGEDLDSRVATFRNAAFLFDGARLGGAGVVGSTEPERVGWLLARYAVEQSRRGDHLLA
jgi:hypothetical protein